MREKSNIFSRFFFNKKSTRKSTPQSTRKSTPKSTRIEFMNPGVLVLGRGTFFGTVAFCTPLPSTFPCTFVGTHFPVLFCTSDGTRGGTQKYYTFFSGGVSVFFVCLPPTRLVTARFQHGAASSVASAD